MRRVGFVLGVSIVMAAMVVLIAGSVLAQDTQPEQTYVQEVFAKQYFAAPGSAASFRGSAEDIEGDGDPGLNGELDTTITYTGGLPGRGVTNTITGGSWTLTGPDVALQGTVSGGTAVWDTKGDTALVPTGLESPQCIRVYAGKAKVEAVFTVTEGTVNGVPVTEEGIGLFKGKLDHKPFLDYKCPGDALGKYPATLTGTLELKF